MAQASVAMQLRETQKILTTSLARRPKKTWS